MQVPFIDLKREWKFFEERFLLAFQKFGRDGIYVLGSEVENFERNFAKYCGYKYCATVSTGLSALEIILRAYNIGKDDGVITVANSAVATALAISNVGAKPVFCDVGDDFLIDTDKIVKLITKKTKAIMPVHLFGRVCNMDKINEIADRFGLIVIEDACQAHGANFIGLSTVNTKAFSFYPTKNLGALGEGGAITTNDDKIFNFVKAYRNYGQEGRYNHVMKAINSRLEPLHCIFLNIKLKYLNQFVKKRQDIAKKYIKEFKDIKGLFVNDFDPDTSYHLFVIRVSGGRRDELRNYLKEKGIEALVHYPIAIHQQPCYQPEYRKLKLKNTDQFQNEIISLPCYPFLSEKESDYIIKSVLFFLKKV